MNLTNFLKKIDALTAQYSEDELISFIHETGRVLPEHHREDFLKRLEAVGEKQEKEPMKEAGISLEFQEMYNRVKNHLERIAEQEVEITSEWNEEYDEWYNSGAEEVLYQDEDGVSEMLEEACDFVHLCMDQEKYQEGYEIGSWLFIITVSCTSDYCDEDLKIGDMGYHGLLHCDLVQVCLDTAYCAYHAVPLEKRSEALYGVIVNARKKELTLEAMMQHGDGELPDFQEFLSFWIAYLGARTGDADRLLLEAVGLLNDVSAATECAEKYVELHPGLYFNILENGNIADAGRMAEIGMKAIAVIPKHYTMRSKVALKTAEYIVEANGNLPLLEKCYFATYESGTCALNYLRALLNGYGSPERRGELRNVFSVRRARESAGSYDRYGNSASSERAANRPDDNMILLLRFLDGQFADVLEKGISCSKALGWSGTFMKQGIALYLLYLYEGKWSGKGMAGMAGIIKSAMHFSVEEYRKGTCGRGGADENEVFCDVFLKWKSMTPMDPDVRSQAIKRIEGLLEKRTEGIMSENRRNYYGECAAYIAALGEVRESLGEAGAKQRIMTDYKEKYSRRNAFRAELRGYGWIDGKKSGKR